MGIEKAPLIQQHIPSQAGLSPSSEIKPEEHYTLGDASRISHTEPEVLYRKFRHFREEHPEIDFPRGGPNKRQVFLRREVLSQFLGFLKQESLSPVSNGNVQNSLPAKIPPQVAQPPVDRFPTGREFRLTPSEQTGQDLQNRQERLRDDAVRIILANLRAGQDHFERYVTSNAYKLLTSCLHGGTPLRLIIGDQPDKFSEREVADGFLIASLDDILKKLQDTEFKPVSEREKQLISFGREVLKRFSAENLRTIVHEHFKINPTSVPAPQSPKD